MQKGEVRVDILLVSGFLGAGKTSFIKAMTRATGRQFVVLENEFGELNLDGPLLQKGAGLAGEEKPQMQIWELTEGCICCSMNQDFSLSVVTIANTLRPDYLLVEPSGVALPGRIIRGLKKISYEHIGLLAPVTIVDAGHFRAARRDYPDYFSDQLAAAGWVVLSKSERMTEDEFAQLERELALGPGVAFPHEHYGKWPKRRWLELLARRLPETGQAPTPHPARAPERALSHMALRGVAFASPASLIPRLDLLVSTVFGRVVRAKGFFQTAFGDWVRFDVVDGIYEISSAPAMDEGQMVIIGEHLEQEGLHRLFGGEMVAGTEEVEGEPDADW